MKTRVIYNTKQLNEFRKIIVQHVKNNIKDYLILSIIFIIGVTAGVVLINQSDEQSKTDISGYINSFLNTIKNEQYEVDKNKLIQTSILKNLKTVAIVWLAGSTVVGIPLIYVIISYKGFCIGYTISAIISSLGVQRRNCIFGYGTAFAKYNYNSNNFNDECECT
ncbi:MAG: stage II sporulation protein M [Clostridia bacterium]|nr:stage II sporulation protein M [Clostridia bacterium]